jgi:hypothetical protein
MLRSVLYRGPSRHVLHAAYAKAGRIDESAPITSSSSIVVDAPADRVWALLSDPRAWPRISPSIRDVRLESDLSVDTCFRFRLYSFPIRARVAVLDPGRELTWTGASLWFRAIDRLLVEPLSARQSRLSIAESFAGILAVPLMSRARLQAQHAQWLHAFKVAAEHGLDGHCAGFQP